MPFDSVEESALRLATYKQEARKTVSAYYLRFQSECTGFEVAVARATHPGRSPYAALSVILFWYGLVPYIKGLSLSDKPIRSLPEAVDRARRHEATNPTGTNPNINTVSAMPFTHVSNRSAIAQQFRRRSQ